MKRFTAYSLFCLLIITGTVFIFGGCKKESPENVNQPVVENISEPSIKSNEKSAEDRSILYYFYGKGCTNCAKTDVIVEDLRKNYKIIVNKYEVWYNDENREFLLKMGKEINYVPTGVPVVIYKKKAYFGISGIMGIEPDIIKSKK